GAPGPRNVPRLAVRRLRRHLPPATDLLRPLPRRTRARHRVRSRRDRGVVDRRPSGRRRQAARPARDVRTRPPRRRRHRPAAPAPGNGRHRWSRSGCPPAGTHRVDPGPARVRADMNFDLTEEQQQLRALVREFADREVAPGAGERDQHETFPIEIVKKMGALGLFGLPIPQEYGGLGADAVTWALVMEELGRVDSSVAVTLSVASGLAGGMVTRFGTATQKERWLPQIAAGEMLAGFALTEPSGGSDIKALRTTARLTDGAWTIDGSKSFITNSGTPITGFLVVACRI